MHYWVQIDRLHRQRIRHFVLLTIAAFWFCLLTTPLKAQSPAAAEWVQQGRILYEAGQFKQALSHWQQAEIAYKKDALGVSGSRINQAQALSAMGLQRRACQTLLAALQPDAMTDRNRLCDPIPYDAKPFQTVPLPPDLQAIGLRSLGNILRLIGNLDASQAMLQQSLEVAPTTAKAETWLSLGNTLRDLGNRDRDRKDEICPAATPTTDCFTLLRQENNAAISYYQQALSHYQQAVSLASSASLTPVQAQLNYLALLIDIEQWFRHHDQPGNASRWITQVYPQMTGLTASLQPQIANLPTTYDSVFARINFARSLVLQSEQIQPLEESKQATDDRAEKIASLVLQSVSRNSDLTVADQLLHDALSQAKALHSTQAEAYAAGTLGWLHEQKGQWTEALTWTRQALNLAGRVQACDLVYQWEWQTGRILKHQGHVDQAIAAYNRAIAALQATRGDLIAVNPDAQFSLRDSVEPVYRELIDLLLPVGSVPGQGALERAIGLVDLLQLTELEDFLHCRLAVSPVVRVDQVNDPTAAIFYPIILHDRIEVILQMPNQPLQRHTVTIEQKPLEQLLGQVRRDLVREPNDPAFDEQAQQQRSGQVYDWLIRPVQATLVKHSIKTLVFVSDGALRNIPVAALYDSQRQSYLVDQYAIAVTPGLKILGAKRYSRDQLRALIAGLTTTSVINVLIEGKLTPFPPLKGVIPEVEAIQKLLPKSEVLRGQDFTAVNVRNHLNSAFYPIVHLASHGNFSSTPQATFILTDSGPPLTIDELQHTLQEGQQVRANAIELLIFSACKTAVGDRRAALGFAGAAVRAGANSTLASLWSVSDLSTALIMERFYQAFTQSSQPITKAEALRIAQRSLRQDNLDYKLPYYWAPFVLVGNWL